MGVREFITEIILDFRDYMYKRVKRVGEVGGGVVYYDVAHELDMIGGFHKSNKSGYNIFLRLRLGKVHFETILDNKFQMRIKKY